MINFLYDTVQVITATANLIILLFRIILCIPEKVKEGVRGGSERDISKRYDYDNSTGHTKGESWKSK